MGGRGRAPMSDVGLCVGSLWGRAIALSIPLSDNDPDCVSVASVSTNG